jgi:L-ascorbate metabolism protein UlaG (beta-lactamase superfamily)
MPVKKDKGLIKAYRKDQELLQEMDSLAGDNRNYHLWWLGQSGFLLQWKGKRVLIDPYLSDSLTKKYSGTEKPHVRMSERVVDPALLKNISIVTSSHNHTDHLDAETLIPVITNNPGIKMIIPEANRKFVAERIKCEEDYPIGLNDGQSVRTGGFRFHGIPAKHNDIERDENGHCKYMGYVIEFDGHKIYHSGDTIWFDEMVEIVKPFMPGLAILPINGNDPSRKVAGNLNHVEAAGLGKAIKAGCVIPCHYDMFTFNTADVKEFEEEARRIDQTFRVLKGGERFQGGAKSR